MEFSLSFHVPNHTFCFRLCVRLQEFLMSGRLLNLVLEFVQGRALQMLRLLSSNAVVSSDQFCFCTCGSDGASVWSRRRRWPRREAVDIWVRFPRYAHGLHQACPCGPRASAEQSRPQPASPPHLSPSSFRRRRHGTNPSRSLIFSAPISPRHYRRGDHWSGRRCDAMMRPAKGASISLCGEGAVRPGGGVVQGVQGNRRCRSAGAGLVQGIQGKPALPTAQQDQATSNEALITPTPPPFVWGFH